MVAVEDPGEPGVDRADDLLFTQVDDSGVVDLVGKRVFGGIAAAVVGSVVIPVALHPASAALVYQQSFERVRMLDADLIAGGSLISGRQAQPGLFEGVVTDERLVCRLIGADPVLGRVPVGRVLPTPSLRLKVDFSTPGGR